MDTHMAVWHSDVCRNLDLIYGFGDGAHQAQWYAATGHSGEPAQSTLRAFVENRDHLEEGGYKMNLSALTKCIGRAGSEHQAGALSLGDECRYKEGALRTLIPEWEEGLTLADQNSVWPGFYPNMC